MARLFGLANYLISDLAMTLMTDDTFSKFVHYKNIGKDDETILELPPLENPIETLRGGGDKQKCQVFLYRRPDKILHEQDVCVFISFDDQKNYNFNSKRVKTVYIKIGLVIHERCYETPHGARDICIISAIEDAIDGKKFVKGLGTCKIEKVNPLYGMPVEYIGHEITCEIDGFKANCGQYFEGEQFKCLM